jgi:hypothetical protein
MARYRSRVPESVPPVVAEAITVWLRCHDEMAPGLVEGLYLVGSVAVDDWRPGSDIDIVAFTAEPATDAEAERLRAAHLAAADRCEAKIDGPRLAWGDISVPPASVHRPWTLDHEFHHDAECFEINPATWFTLANYGVGWRGPHPGTLSIAAPGDELQAFVRANVDTYWRSVADAVGAAAADPERSAFEPAITEWCVLGAARMLYTTRTGDVASKSAAGRWLARQLPEHSAIAHHAVAIREATDPTGPDDRAIVAATEALLRDVVALITGR